MDWRIVIGAAAVGVVLLLVAVQTDRRSRRRREKAMLPPDRPIPNLPEGAPAYLSADQANTPPAGSTARPASAGDRRLAGDTPQLPAGWADPRFVTDAESGWAVLHDAVVVVVEALGSVRELIPLLERAGGRPLVIVAGDVDPDTLDTLAVNVVQKKRQALLVRVGLEDLRAAAVGTGVEVLDRTSLQAGWFPKAALAEATVWVSSRSASWFVV